MEVIQVKSKGVLLKMCTDMSENVYLTRLFFFFFTQAQGRGGVGGQFGAFPFKLQTTRVRFLFFSLIFLRKDFSFKSSPLFILIMDESLTLFFTNKSRGRRKENDYRVKNTFFIAEKAGDPGI